MKLLRFGIGIVMDYLTEQKLRMLTHSHMTTVEKKQPYPLAQHATNSELQLRGYPQYNPDGEIFRKGKRIQESLEDAYDRLNNNKTRISTLLRTSSVSNHLECADSSRYGGGLEIAG